jgi:hypothetical protein
MFEMDSISFDKRAISRSKVALSIFLSISFRLLANNRDETVSSLFTMISFPHCGQENLSILLEIFNLDAQEGQNNLLYLGTGISSPNLFP